MTSFDTLVFQRIHNYSKGVVENQETDSLGKLPLLYEENGSGNKSKPPGGFSFATEDHQVENEPLKSFHSLDALFHDTTPPFRSYEHKMQELADIESQYSELIKQPEVHVVHIYEESARYEASGPKMSSVAVIRLGGERFIQSCSSSHAYGSSFSGLSDQEVKDVQLVENLLLSAEKVAQQQFERSIKLLDWCDVLSSSTGNPIQRLVYYFSKALREKVDKETGRVSFNGLGTKQGTRHTYDIAERLIRPNTTVVLIYEKWPLYQAGHFSGVQALMDGVSGSKRVHVIDLSIKQGVQCTILMQALVSQPNCVIEHLKITAIGTTSKQNIERTGDWLKSFAESINLSFSFYPVIVEDMLNLTPDLLKLDPDEALGVYASFGLWTMIAHQDRLESLMNVMKSCNPRVMVVGEVEANLNSPNFVSRFIEALFYYGALFDSLDECMGREDENRGITELLYLGNGIKSIVASEGAERAIRHVNIGVWRKFFVRFGMKEVELSMSSLYQANLVAEKFPSGRCCTFDRDGGSLVIGWKGTPVMSISAWEFS